MWFWFTWWKNSPLCIYTTKVLLILSLIICYRYKIKRSIRLLEKLTIIYKWLIKHLIPFFIFNKIKSIRENIKYWISTYRLYTAVLQIKLRASHMTSTCFYHWDILSTPKLLIFNKIELATLNSILYYKVFLLKWLYEILIEMQSIVKRLNF
jgi:hypothetical protein